VDSRRDLFALKDRLEAADIEVEGAVDHGIFWSIYFYDPNNNIPLEATWQFMDILQYPAISEDDPLDIVAEGADPQTGHWPTVEHHTSESDMRASGGNGHPMRQHFLNNGLAKYSDGVSIEFQNSLESGDIE
jgi:hypothetical protein